MVVKYFQFPGIDNVKCLFSGRDKASGHYAGNISFKSRANQLSVLQNRRQLFAMCQKMGMTAWSECQQVHGTHMLAEPKAADIASHPDSLPQADGMCCSSSGQGLLIKTADCQPVLLCDKKGSHIMALHIGWRGNRANFAQKAVLQFCARYNLKPEDLYAVRGPSLGPEHAEFVNFNAEWGENFQPWFNSHTKCMDLWQLTRDQLLNAGLRTSHVFDIPICTFSHSDDWFSWRREKHDGRQAALIWIVPANQED